ncbi:MAG: hypothetical protein M3326_02970 [Actinomycetota bacterium]|nr:hypothetical protein [Actinomycetota bacterium]
MRQQAPVEERQATTGWMRPALRVLPHPGRTFAFEWLRAQPAPAIALDGCVRGPSRWCPDGPYASMNHHEGVDRGSTRATCEQAVLLVSQGLWDTMTRDGVPCADVHVNDCDADVCTAVWALGHPDRLDEPAVQRLIGLEGILDTTGGCFTPPWADSETLAELAWTFEPYQGRRDHGDPIDGVVMTAVIEEVGDRITALVDGRGDRRPAWGDFELVARRGAVAAVVEHGPYARIAARRAGIQTLVAERRCGDRRVITLAKTSPFVTTDLNVAYARLNRLDGCPDDDGWGGSDLVGGSPRGRGTGLALDLILETVAGT